MFDWIVFYTFIGLVIFFVTVEIYRARNYIKGIVLEIPRSELGLAELISTTLKVKLNDGSIVTAEAMRCTMCMGNLTTGDQVFLTKSKGKFIVNLPIRFKRTASTKTSCCPTA